MKPFGLEFFDEEKRTFVVDSSHAAKALLQQRVRLEKVESWLANFECLNLGTLRALWLAPVLLLLCSRKITCPATSHKCRLMKVSSSKRIILVRKSTPICRRVKGTNWKGNLFECLNVWTAGCGELDGFIAFIVSRNYAVRSHSQVYKLVEQTFFVYILR